jgi:hypothetical protein
MTQERASSPEQTLARMLSITRRTGFATPGPWGYVRPSGVICAPDTSDVAHCLHDPDAVFIAHARSDVPWLLGRLQAERSSDPTLDAQLLDRVLVLRAEIRVANEELNALPWQGDGLSGFVAEGLDRDRAMQVCQVQEALASALGPEALGLKDSDR